MATKFYKAADNNVRQRRGCETLRRMQIVSFYLRKLYLIEFGKRVESNLHAKVRMAGWKFTFCFWRGRSIKSKTKLFIISMCALCLLCQVYFTAPF